MMWQLLIGVLCMTQLVKAADAEVQCQVNDIPELNVNGQEADGNSQVLYNLLIQAAKDPTAHLCRYGKVKNGNCNITPQCEKERKSLKTNLLKCAKELTNAGIDMLGQSPPMIELVNFEIAKVRVYYQDSKLEEALFVGADANGQLDRLNLVIPPMFQDIVRQYSLDPENFALPIPANDEHLEQKTNNLKDMTARFLQRACGDTFTTDQLEGVREGLHSLSDISKTMLAFLEGESTSFLKNRMAYFMIKLKDGDLEDLQRRWRALLKPSDESFGDLIPYCMNPQMSANHDNAVKCNLKRIMNQMISDSPTNFRIQSIDCPEMDCLCGPSFSGSSGMTSSSSSHSYSYSSSNGGAPNFRSESQNYVMIP